MNSSTIKIVLLFALMAFSIEQEFSSETLALEKIMNEHPKTIFKVWHSLFKKSEYSLDDDIAINKYNVFESNLQEIKRHNAGNHGWEKGLNQFSDLTMQEFEDLYTMKNYEEKVPSFEKIKQTFTSYNFNNFMWVNSYYKTSDNVPLNPFSWVTDCPTVYNQGACGNCYLFGVTSAMECNYLLANPGKTLVVSRQHSMDCDSLNNACGGGDPTITTFFYTSFGVFTSAQYPYIGTKQATCKHNSLISAGIMPQFLIKGFHTTCQAYEDATCISIQGAYQLLKKGPFATTIDATPLYAYKGGILTQATANCTKINHIVVVIGFGVDATHGNFFIIKNSWGTTWGEAGYVRLQVIEGHATNCYIFNQMVRPIMK